MSDPMPTRWHIGGLWVIKLRDHAWPGYVVCEVVEAGVMGHERWEVGTLVQVKKTDLQHTMADAPADALGMD